MSLYAQQEASLAGLREDGRYRSLRPRSGLDYASNDYLGLAQSPLMRQAARDALERGVPVGSGGSRLLRGNHAEHEALEAEAAAFFGTEAALFLGAGFTANMAIFATLPQRGDLVLFDALIHASVHDGMRLGRAECRSFRHGDVDAAETQIVEWRRAGGTGRVWIAVESIYSMDGDIAPIADLVALADRLEAVLVVDEAHATGLYGDMGRGFSHPYAGRENVLSLHTGGKALGVSGGLVCGPAVLIEMLINWGRGFIFATAPSPLTAALMRRALREMQDNPGLRDRALSHISQVHDEARELCGLEGFQCQILPVIIGEDRKAMAVAAALQARGYDIRGIRPPTVPAGSARLRISLTLNTTPAQNSAMVRDLAEVIAAQPNTGTFE